MSAGLVGATPFLDSSIGFEEATRGGLKLLIQNLNDEITKRSAMWDQADLEWQDLVGVGPGQVDVPLIAPGHWHEGPHQSIIKAPIESFPVVSAMAYFNNPSGGAADQHMGGDLRFFVEAFVATGPVSEDATSEADHETIVHRRIARVTEAINAVIMRDLTLCGTVKPGISGLPVGGLGSQSWVRRQEKGTGPRHLWQGSRLEYRLQRHSRY